MDPEDRVITGFHCTVQDMINGNYQRLCFLKLIYVHDDNIYTSENYQIGAVESKVTLHQKVTYFANMVIDGKEKISSQRTKYTQL